MKRFVITALAGLLAVGTPAALAGGKPSPKPHGMSVYSAGISGSGWLGVTLENPSAEDMKSAQEDNQPGAVIQHVQKDSPAAKAGFQPGDMVIRFAGIPVLGTNHLRDLVRDTVPGRVVKVDILRKGSRETLSVTIEEREGNSCSFAPGRDLHIEIPDMEELKELQGLENLEGLKNLEELKQLGQLHNLKGQYFFFSGKPRLGVETSPLGDQMAAFLEVPGNFGVLVNSVRKDSPADKAGIKAGDVIQAVDGAEVKTPTALSRLVMKHKGEDMTLKIVRKGRTMDVKVVLPKEEEDKKNEEHSHRKGTGYRL